MPNCHDCQKPVEKPDLWHSWIWDETKYVPHTAELCPECYRKRVEGK